MNTKFLFVSAAIAATAFSCAHKSDIAQTEFTGKRALSSSHDCDAEKFIKRVDAKCDLSGNDQSRIRNDAKYCKNVISKGNNLELVILDKTGDLAIIDTRQRGSHGEKCARGRFSFGSGFEDMKVVDGYVYLVSEVGNLYVYSSFSRKLYMILSSGGNPYAEVNPVLSIEGKKIVDNKRTGEGHPGLTVNLKNGNPATWDSDRLNDPLNTQLRQVFASEVTGLSIFNDK